MNWTLEVVVIPVTDVDRAKAFYADQVGFNVDHDVVVRPGQRILQLTPPGSGCSIVIDTGENARAMVPGSLKGVQLVVNDVRAAHAELTKRGVDVGDVQVAGPGGFRPATDDDTELNNIGFLSFDDPDGNGWVVQEITARA